MIEKKLTVKDLIKWLEDWDGNLNIMDTDLDDAMSYELGIYIERAKMPVVSDVEDA